MGKSPNDTIATQEMENLVDVQIVRKSADPIHHDQEAEEIRQVECIYIVAFTEACCKM